MKFSRGRSQVVFWFLALLLLAVRSHAVLFKSTADPSYNTNAPTGSLTNSGWQYEGQWNGFLATPIAPAFFIAAKHVGGSMGDVFVLNGFTYHTVAFSDCPNCDLRVWQVAETFPMYAPLYTNANEVGNHCVVFGRGTQRGDAVIVGGTTSGWKWGSGDGVQRWGENDVTSIYDDPNLGQFLQCTFDRNGGSNECHLSVGDSSGAMFIQDGSTWKLAGIHYAVDGYFSTDGTTDTQFDAALTDMGGLWIGSGTDWTFITNRVYDIPSSFYSTRISSKVSWINSVINFFSGNDLRITGIQLAGTDIQITLATGSNRLYRVEQTSDLVTGVWTTLTNNVAGTGGAVTVTDPGGATQSKQFYRAVLLQ
jgi:hypothetical protein